jgi:palmitoyl transferase
MHLSLPSCFKKKTAAALLGLSLPLACFADGILSDAVSSISQEIESEWNRSMNGANELYVPVETWHNRLTYDHDKISSFNERPWGLGFGKGYVHENGDWSGFYAMAFKDSHNAWEPIAGYGRTWNVHPLDNAWFVGAGYTVFLTSREDIMGYLPFPGVLPLVSTGYKSLTFQGTYIPGKRNNGNVAFFWGKYAF